MAKEGERKKDCARIRRASADDEEEFKLVIGHVGRIIRE